MTLVFQLCIEVHGSSCMKQEVHYVMTWTKQPHVLQKQFLANVKSKNIPLDGDIQQCSESMEE